MPRRKKKVSLDEMMSQQNESNDALRSEDLGYGAAFYSSFTAETMHLFERFSETQPCEATGTDCETQSLRASN